MYFKVILFCWLEGRVEFMKQSAGINDHIFVLTDCSDGQYGNCQSTSNNNFK